MKKAPYTAQLQILPKLAAAITAFLVLLLSGVGCHLRDQARLAVPTNLRADRKEPKVYVSWRGETTNYDFQQSLQDATKRWANQSVEHLMNVPTEPNTGTYFKDANALPQPMRFRVAAVRGKETSRWTAWVTNSPHAKM